MPLGTLDRNPPPLFRQGPSALTMLSFCSALALLLMVADTRFQLTRPLRAAVATALHPVQRALLSPVEAWTSFMAYGQGIQAALQSQEAARRQMALQSQQLARLTQLEQENRHLRELLRIQPQQVVPSMAAQVIYEAADPFSRKVVLDRGAKHGISAGSPVINELGVLGQVTRVYPLSSEVTLLADKDAAIPVLNTRTQAKSAAFGTSSARGGAVLEMRYMAGNSDVQVGDLLTTTGVDGIYPAALPVARVASVDRKADSGFARITLSPVAHSDSVRHVLVLQPLSTLLTPRPVEADAEEPRSRTKTPLMTPPRGGSAP
jgi:rod shape-determining protein MreC